MQMVHNPSYPQFSPGGGQGPQSQSTTAESNGGSQQDSRGSNIHGMINGPQFYDQNDANYFNMQAQQENQ